MAASEEAGRHAHRRSHKHTLPSRLSKTPDGHPEVASPRGARSGVRADSRFQSALCPDWLRRTEHTLCSKKATSPVDAVARENLATPCCCPVASSS